MSNPLHTPLSIFGPQAYYDTKQCICLSPPSEETPAEAPPPGQYRFVSRHYKNTYDMQDWTGTLELTFTNILKYFQSPDGKKEKYYTSSIENIGMNIFKTQFLDAYNPSYAGMINTNEMALVGNLLFITNPYVDFREVWIRE